MKRLVFLVGILFLYLIPARQAAVLWAGGLRNWGTHMQSQAKRQTGSLTGHVITDAGKPLTNARISINRVGDEGTMNTRTTATDERGRFQISSLLSGSYTVSVRAPGYVKPESAIEPRYYRPGDYIALTMLKGGVVTGSVRTRSGEALINVPVRAYCVRDSEGKPNTASASVPYRLTDDRGIYRLYGLPPGEYLLSAGGGTRSYAGFNKYEHDSPTFYPSSTRPTAEKVTLQPGQEVSDINIVYREEAGYVVSGVATGTEANQFSPSITIALAGQSTGEIRDIGHTVQGAAFAFYGVPDGDYFLIAKYFSGDERTTAVSRPYRFRVAGADVPRITLTLSRLGSVSGRVVLEPLPKDPPQKCGRTEPIAVEETILSLERERPKDEQEILWQTSEVYGALDENGLFSVYGMTGGRYRISPALPSGNWFTKAVAIVKRSAGKAMAGTNSGALDPVVGSLQVQPGRPTQLTITLAEGAATLNGSVSLTKARTPSSRLSVHLVPTERKDFDNPFRFFQTDVQDDGTFLFKSIAPGKYSIFARATAGKPSESSSSDPSPWNVGGRTILRKEVKSTGTIEFHPCQSIHDYVVSYDRIP